MIATKGQAGKKNKNGRKASKAEEALKLDAEECTCVIGNNRKKKEKSGQNDRTSFGGKKGETKVKKLTQCYSIS